MRRHAQPRTSCPASSILCGERRSVVLVTTVAANAVSLKLVKHAGLLILKRVAEAGIGVTLDAEGIRAYVRT